jgi:hypothetical protein
VAVVPGQEFGMADVDEVGSRRFSFYFGDDPAWGNWIPHLLRRKDLHRERCVVIGAQERGEAATGGPLIGPLATTAILEMAASVQRQ